MGNQIPYFNQSQTKIGGVNNKPELFPKSALWKGFSGVAASTGNEVNDYYTRVEPAKYVKSNCLYLDGVTTINFSDLSGITIVSSEGTAVLDISDNSITSTVGTVWNIRLSDGTFLGCAEGAGTTIYDSSGNGNHGTLIDATLSTAWGQTQDVIANNISNGFNKYMYFDGDSTEVVTNTNTGMSFDGVIIEAGITKNHGNGVIMWTQSNLLEGILSLILDSDGKLILELTNEGHTTATSTISISDQDSYVRCYISRNSTITFYSKESEGDEYTQLGDILTQWFYVEYSISFPIYFDTILSFFDPINIGSHYTNSGYGSYVGVLHDIKLRDDRGIIGHWKGYGNTDSQWVDQVYNNDGIVNGDPSNIYIPAKTDTKDIFDTNLRNLPNKLHNGAESNIIFIDSLNFIDNITVDDGVSYNQLYADYLGVSIDRGTWGVDDIVIYYDGTKWKLVDNGDTMYEIESDTTFPPISGWTTVSGIGSLSLQYDNIFINDGEFTEISWDDLNTIYNSKNGVDGNYLKKFDEYNFDVGLHYKWVFHNTTSLLHAKLLDIKYGGELASLKDDNGYIIDVNEHVIYTH